MRTLLSKLSLESVRQASSRALMGLMQAAISGPPHCRVGMFSSETSLCLLFIHPGAPNLISLRSAGTIPA